MREREKNQVSMKACFITENGTARFRVFDVTECANQVPVLMEYAKQMMQAMFIWNRTDIYIYI